MAVAELKGLVLAGGLSTRMGADKAFLEYNGESQARFLVQALSAVCGDVRVSVNRRQSGDRRLGGLKLIADRDEGIGPMAGLLSAFACDPEAAWLAVAVDMPRVTAGTLLRLAGSRDASAYATAFKNPETGLPEPVLAIYEPRIRESLESAKARGRYSLMLLRDVPIRLIEAGDALELQNVNDGDEYRRYREGLDGGGRGS